MESDKNSLRIDLAKSKWKLLLTGMMRTCSGASQSGKAPAKCSVMTPMNLSMEPKHAL